ncbi:MAG: hydantoinase/oxoprolinase family protein [Clostridiaceae bacterium]|nr:hydantoinase/oxoprolinase family protein [Clostridiaceae bacterium]
MYIGIDLGGTFTDGVIIAKNRVVKAIKVRTQEDISVSIENALQELLQGIAPEEITQVNLSTTLITNLIAQNKLSPVGLLLIPGPGVNPHRSKFAGETKVLHGAVDYRGRIIEPLVRAEIEEACTFFQERNINRLAVACKFSQRNPALENEIVEYIQQKDPSMKLLASHEVSGLLNWIRRANGAYYTLATREACNVFSEKIAATLQKMHLSCPVFLLKADGGTLPLAMSLRYPLETIFSGPVASTLGALACTEELITSVVIDLGGTTADLALLLEGKPLLAAKGALIKQDPVPVRSLAISSLALGGDTPLFIEQGQLRFGQRQGPAFCLGGPVLTITDVLVFLGYSDLSSPDRVKEQLEKMAASLQLTPDNFSCQVLDLFIAQIERELQKMFKAWEEEPAYRIWQVLSAHPERPQTIICLGGPALGLGKYWREKQGREVIVPGYAAVANAIGAALARTTFELDFFADTEQNTYTTNIGGVQGLLRESLKSTDEAREYALKLFQQTALKWQLKENAPWEILYEEGFNVVRNWQTVGRIFQVGLQTVPGIREFIKEEEDNA